MVVVEIITIVELSGCILFTILRIIDKLWHRFYGALGSSRIRGS